MTNRLAVYMFLFIVCFLVWDGYDNNGDATLFLLKKFSSLVEWLAFWR